LLLLSPELRTTGNPPAPSIVISSFFTDIRFNNN
jgi:hypothetical protein